MLGASAGTFQPENVRLRIENATRDGYINVMFDADATSLNGVEITVNGDSEDCEKLGEKLADEWGHASNGAWLDSATHQRATFDVRAIAKCRWGRLGGALPVVPTKPMVSPFWSGMPSAIPFA